jgi:hypothetical protein
MACRDYEYEYQAWAQRAQEHLAKMTDMLRRQCQTANERGYEIPPSVNHWLAEPTPGYRVQVPTRLSNEKLLGCLIG